MHEYDSSFVFMPLDVAGKLFGMDSRVSGLEIYTADPENIAGVRAMVADGLGDGLKAFDWLQRNGTFINALRVEAQRHVPDPDADHPRCRLQHRSSMIMLVRSKNADIAVLRAMGASSGAIMRIFLMTGASIGVVGTLAGTVLGLLFCWKIGSIQGFIESGLRGRSLCRRDLFPVDASGTVDPTEVGLVILMALVLSFLASLYPAWRAGLIAPAEVLRHE